MGGPSEDSGSICQRQPKCQCSCTVKKQKPKTRDRQLYIFPQCRQLRNFLTHISFIYYFIELYIYSFKMRRYNKKAQKTAKNRAQRTVATQSCVIETIFWWCATCKNSKFGSERRNTI